MRWLLALIRRVFSFRRNTNDRGRLIGIYFDESNSRGMRKPNRDRA